VAERTLHREDWARAALNAMAAGGVPAVKVEALARTLGATKGSFYWHFADRPALVDAAVALWEQTETDAIIDSLADATDPRERLGRLFSIIFVQPELGAVDAALIAARDQPAIGKALRRVTDRRVRFMRDAFAEMGFDGADADRRALYTHGIYLGLVVVRRANPDAVPASDSADAFADDLLDVLTATG
jgi:AcrR family transcriptional regulator